MANSAPAPNAVLKRRTRTTILAELKRARREVGGMMNVGSTDPNDPHAAKHREIDALLDELAICDLS